MGTKLNPGAYDCYANAEPDEPMFVLLGRDKHAPTLVWLWAALRELDQEDAAKVAEARDCVTAMLTWQRDHGRAPGGLGSAALAAVLELIRAANESVRIAVNQPTSEAQVRLFLAETVFDFEGCADAAGAAPTATRGAEGA
jgi:hypothetical protein